MTKPLSFCSFLIITAIILLSAYASDGPALSGSSLKLDDEVASATEIVIAKFTEITEGASSTLSGYRYKGLIAISDILKGNAPVSSKIAFTVGMQTKESVPNLSDIYILILDNHHIRKLLPATDANVAKIKALIAATPVSK